MNTSIGRIVHYRGLLFAKPVIYPAIITAIDPEDTYNLTLTVFTTQGAKVVKDATFSVDDDLGTWFWPPRV